MRRGSGVSSLSSSAMTILMAMSSSMPTYWFTLVVIQGRNIATSTLRMSTFVEKLSGNVSCANLWSTKSECAYTSPGLRARFCARFATRWPDAQGSLRLVPVGERSELGKTVRREYGALQEERSTPCGRECLQFFFTGLPRYFLGVAIHRTLPPHLVPWSQDSARSVPNSTVRQLEQHDSLEGSSTVME